MIGYVFGSREYSSEKRICYKKGQSLIVLVFKSYRKIKNDFYTLLMV